MGEVGILIPPFEAPEEKGGIDVWLGFVADAISRKGRWRLLADMVVDFFSFTKFVMYKDLDPSGWPSDKKPHDHPLLRTLFDPAPGAADDPGFDEREIDILLTARDLIHVMDADPSQIAVTQDVRAGRNLVVQGPPGTGKSQTITNLIGETLAAGKTVLFVSEKMAALEVVKARLDRAGLGPFCLELHSRKSKKKAVLDELQKSLSSQPATGRDDALTAHDQLKADLNTVAADLAKPVGQLSFSPYELYGMRDQANAHFGRSGRPLPSIPSISNSEDVTQGDFETATAALNELSSRLSSVQPTQSHVWRHCARASMHPHQESELKDALAAARLSVKQLREAAATLSRVSGCLGIARLSDVDRAVAAATVLSSGPRPLETELLLSEWAECAG
jgi:hypothetical protein